MSRTYRTFGIYSYGTKRSRGFKKFNRKAEFISRGFSKHMKVSGRYSLGGWINTNHVRGLLKKYVGKSFDDFYSEFSELYRNTSFFTDKRSLIDVYKPLVLLEDRMPSVKLMISTNRYGGAIIDEVIDLQHEYIIPERVVYQSAMWNRGTLYNLEELSKQHHGAFYLDNGIIRYLKHIPYKHGKHETYAVGRVCRVNFKGRWQYVYIAEKDQKEYVKSASEIWREQWEARKLKEKAVRKSAEYEQRGTRLVEHLDFDEDYNLVVVEVEEPRFKRKKTYRYNREYLTKEERKALQETEKK